MTYTFIFDIKSQKIIYLFVNISCQYSSSLHVMMWISIHILCSYLLGGRWEKDVVGMVEQKDGKNKIFVSFVCETLKAEKAAEDHIRQFMPKLAGVDAVGMWSSPFFLLSFALSRFISLFYNLYESFSYLGNGLGFPTCWFFDPQQFKYCYRLKLLFCYCLLFLQKDTC